MTLDSHHALRALSVAITVSAAHGLAAVGCGDDAGFQSGGAGGADGGSSSTSASRSSASTASSADGGSADGGGGDGSPGSTAAGAPTSSSSSSGDGGGGGTAVVMANVHVEARTVEVDGGVRRFGWSNGTVRTRIDGTDLSMQMSSPTGIWFTVEVDGEAVRNFQVAGGLQTEPIVTGLPPGQHDVAVIRRNEGSYGTTDFVALIPGAGTTIVPTPAKSRRLEFIGDSLTAGYGIEGVNPCNFSAETESSYETYAAIAARGLGAEAHIVAQSGKGVIQNYGGNLDGVMPDIWSRAFTGSADPQWDFSEWKPDAVMVNLGTNDFSAAFDEGAFVDGYAAFLGEIRAVYPDAPIVCVTWAIWGGAHEALVEEAVAATADPAIHTTRFTWDTQGEGVGCDGHTNVVTNARLGSEVQATLATLLGW